jgi:hypothetical protein
VTRLEAAMILGVAAFVVVGLLSGELRFSIAAGVLIGAGSWMFDILTERRG